MSSYLLKHLSWNFDDSTVTKKLIDCSWQEAMVHFFKVSLQDTVSYYQFWFALKIVFACHFWGLAIKSCAFAS